VRGKLVAQDSANMVLVRAEQAAAAKAEAALAEVSKMRQQMDPLTARNRCVWLLVVVACAVTCVLRCAVLHQLFDRNAPPPRTHTVTRTQ
jgi:hypothetical protein